jgi:hypothetical protein
MLRLRREARHFKLNAINSLIMAIELFNRPHECCRTESVLFYLQHAFEMLFKAAIYQQRRTVHEPGSNVTYRFDKCLGIARSELNILTEDGANNLAILDGFRDCAMHYLLEMSEESLYLQAQAAITIFNDILSRAFGQSLSTYLPNRVLPVSTNPPEDINLFMNKEFEHISNLVAPRKRMRAEARARIRPYLIMESVLKGEYEQPTNKTVTRIISRIKEGEDWRVIFPNVAALRFDTEGSGLTYSVRISREREAPPVRILHDGETAEDVALIREVNLIDRYSMGLYDLADKLGLGRNKTLALVQHLNLQNDPDCFREFRHRSMKYKGYSPKALEKLKDALPSIDIDDIWRKYLLRQKRKRLEHNQ